ncbi:MAG: glycosyltransferase family 1 protein [Alphaproteobacteria bacterium]|nr:glycosyltransferase family 1 protein [Alphaproteobacteria bacterium]
MAVRLRIVVTGLIAQHPRLGGVAWDYVQYPAGLARLGHDVTYVEDSGEWAYNFDGGPTGNDHVARDPAPTLAHLARVMERFGLADRWAYRFPLTGQWFGLPDARRREIVANADLVLNVSGTIEHPERYRGRGHLVYIDSDPVFTQARIALGDADFVTRQDAHDCHFSFGERHSSRMPRTAVAWRPTRQPILLDAWSSARPIGAAYTTVMSWTSYKPLRWGGLSLGQKDIEFRRFLDLPGRVPSVGLEVALGPTRHRDWEAEGAELPQGLRAAAAAHSEWSVSDLLRHAGWRVADALAVGGDVDSYRDYIQGSRGEWSVAKNGYVLGQPGWFSCRSACYLAAGRPVVVQDTGFPAVIPSGRGLFAFADPDQAVAALETVERDPAAHGRAARELAHEFFSHDRVLPRLIDDALGAAAGRPSRPAEAAVG